MIGPAERIARFVLAIDDRDWDRVVDCLAETVSRDYRSLSGAEPDEIGGADLVAEWRRALEGLDSHQHVLGPVVVTEAGDDRVAASAHVVGTHVRAGDPGSPWVVGGTYRIGLRPAGGEWRIASLRLDVRWQTGDGALLERAAAAG